MSAFNLTGRIVEIFDTVEVNDKFRKREFVIQTGDDPKYPQVIKLEMVNDKCMALDAVQIGQTVEVLFDIRGRKWTDRQGAVKYFNTLQAFRLVTGPAATDDRPRDDRQAPASGLAKVASDPQDSLPF